MTNSIIRDKRREKTLMELFTLGYNNQSFHETHCTHFKGDFITTLLGSLVRFHKLQKPYRIQVTENGGYRYKMKDEREFIFRQVPAGLSIFTVSGKNKGKMILLERPCPEMLAEVEILAQPSATNRPRERKRHKSATPTSNYLKTAPRPA